MLLPVRVVVPEPNLFTVRFPSRIGLKALLPVWLKFTMATPFPAVTRAACRLPTVIPVPMFNVPVEPTLTATVRFPAPPAMITLPPVRFSVPLPYRPRRNLSEFVQFPPLTFTTPVLPLL